MQEYAIATKQIQKYGIVKCTLNYCFSSIFFCFDNLYLIPLSIRQEDS